MAERETRAQAQVAPPDDQFQRVSRATAEAQKEADAANLDEAPEGGRYVMGDTVVDSEGKPVKKD